MLSDLFRREDIPVLLDLSSVLADDTGAFKPGMFTESVTPKFCSSGLDFIKLEGGEKVVMIFLKRLWHGSRFWPKVNCSNFPVLLILSIMPSTECRELYMTLRLGVDSEGGKIWNRWTCEKPSNQWLASYILPSSVLVL